MKWPCRREAPPGGGEQKLGKQLKKAIDKAMDDAGIRPGFPGDDRDGERESSDEE